MTVGLAWDPCDHRSRAVVHALRSAGRTGGRAIGCAGCQGAGVVMTTRVEEAQLAEARRRLAHAMENPDRLGNVDVPGPAAEAVARHPLRFALPAAGALASTALVARQRRRRQLARRRRWPIIAGTAAAVGLAIGMLLGARQASSRAA